MSINHYLGFIISRPTFNDNKAFLTKGKHSYPHFPGVNFEQFSLEGQTITRRAANILKMDVTLHLSTSTI